MDSIQLARGRADHPLVGTVVHGEYCVVGLLHRGRRNDLFVAEQTERDDVRSLVLKIPHELSVETAEVLAREAAFLQQIEHPNVVVAYDVGTDDERAYLAIEPIAGETLAERIERDGPLSGRETLAIFWQVLSAARAMHERGIVHRDLRPRNVCLEYRDDQPPLVKLIDFAAAKFTRDVHPDSQREPAYPVGAHRYMAPEQHRGEPAGPEVDIYAIGMMVYASLSGELPEPGARLGERCAVSEEVESVVTQALADDPDARFKTSLELQDALTRALLVG